MKTKTLFAKVKFTNEIENKKRGDVVQKLYDYLTFFDDLKEGDLVVVGTRFGYTVAEFISYQDEKGQCKSYIVDKVDTSLYESFQARQYKIKKLNEEIEERAKKAFQRQKLDELSVSDKTLKAMLDTLDSLLEAD
ncbi:hypothetical protein CHT76_08700 [Listeria monocytogenes]|nr:hypothetical protein [Listeria monocytogenes]EAG8712031.1 hypothetical protein [Listeria monocytogenes]EAG8730877.1 hypothetical protein [Listeria monocytogenes]